MRIFVEIAHQLARRRNRTRRGSPQTASHFRPAPIASTKADSARRRFQADKAGGAAKQHPSETGKKRGADSKAVGGLKPNGERQKAIINPPHQRFPARPSGIRRRLMTSTSDRTTSNRAADREMASRMGRTSHKIAEGIRPPLREYCSQTPDKQRQFGDLTDAIRAMAFSSVVEQQDTDDFAEAGRHNHR